MGEEQNDDAEIEDIALSVQLLAIPSPETKDPLCCNEGQDRGDRVANDGDSDDEGWITPENIRQVCEQMGGAKEVDSDGIAVGCMTTDYAMQVSDTGSVWMHQFITYSCAEFLL